MGWTLYAAYLPPLTPVELAPEATGDQLEARGVELPNSHLGDLAESQDLSPKTIHLRGACPLAGGNLATLEHGGNRRVLAVRPK